MDRYGIIKTRMGNNRIGIATKRKEKIAVILPYNKCHIRRKD